jgi:allophanate hydrolase
MTRLSASAIAAAVRAREKTAEHFAQEALARLCAYDAIQPQTWIERIAPERALEAARVVDARVAAGETPPLAGVPFAVKDNLDVAGLPTSAACPSAAFTPPRSAAVVERLEAAGAILIGKTNLDQFATGLVGVRSPYGACGCVFNRDYVSGGSSSGSAVAVAAGVVAFALGSDTAGSGRVPAAFNHLIGLKPTKGRWSTRGLLPACRSLDCVSVLANDVADAALVDSVLAGFDAEDVYSRRAPKAPRIDTPRIGAAAPGQLDFSGDADSQKLFAEARSRLESLGGALIEVDIAPLLDCAKLLYGGPWVAERTAALAALIRSNSAAIHPVVRGIVEQGAAFSAVDAFEGCYALKVFERAAEALWREVDVLLLPTAPTIYRIDAVRADPIALNAVLGRYTNFVNLLDMSAVALPAGFRGNRTGFGITLIGPAWAEPTLLALAARYEESFPMSDTPPLDVAPRAPMVELAVVGAHLHGMPLHHQLESRNARFVRKARTAPAYKLYAMPTTPPKPALIHAEGGAAIELEIYELSVDAFGSFVAEVPAPLAIGTVSLEGGGAVKGFVAEPRAMIGATEITSFGGWRAYIASLQRR